MSRFIYPKKTLSFIIKNNVQIILKILKMKSGKENQYKGAGFGGKLLNTTVKEYRLNKKQQIFYTELFNKNSTNGKVKKEDFKPLS